MAEAVRVPNRTATFGTWESPQQMSKKNDVFDFDDFDIGDNETLTVAPQKQAQVLSDSPMFIPPSVKKNEQISFFQVTGARHEDKSGLFATFGKHMERIAYAMNSINRFDPCVCPHPGSVQSAGNLFTSPSAQLRTAESVTRSPMPAWGGVGGGTVALFASSESHDDDKCAKHPKAHFHKGERCPECNK